MIDVDPGQAVPGAGLHADGYTGHARMVVDEDHGCLLGVTFVGPGGPWCLPPVNRYATQGSLRVCVRLSHLDDVNAL